MVPITSALNSFEKTPRLDKRANILTFWEDNKLIMPELYKLAQTVLAVPATQVSVERLFSGMKFILSHLRASMNSDILEDILIVRSNAILNF
jgi:hAT family C-terminal dimerisation region